MARDQIDSALRQSLDAQRLGEKLAPITRDGALVAVLYGFALFNDALAARVPLLAGVIHATPGIFLDRAAIDLEFLQRRNAQVAAYVAYAASDEYSLDARSGGVHQRMSQQFFESVLSYPRTSEIDLCSDLVVRSDMTNMLCEATNIFLMRADPEDVLRAIGFHVALEFGAGEEFRAFDHFLRTIHPQLVAHVQHQNSGYDWISIHTVVEDQHYKAGMQAIDDALRFYAGPRSTESAERLVLDGVEAFAELQRRYYNALLS